MAQDHAAFRLPRTVEPRRYELTLWPDLEVFSFTGTERVLVRVLEPVSELVLNAVELEVRSATMEREGNEPVEAAVSYEPGDERVRLTLPTALDPGDWTLHLAFAGQITDELRGFYRSTFRDIDGRERVLGTTQFEATDARRAFPCWDEPDRKATFALTLVIDPALTAVSNTSVAAEAEADGGRRQVSFAETIPMSSYLVAFVIGPLEATAPVEVDGVPLRIVHVPGKGGLTSFALEAATHALGFFAEWFAIAYPGDKLDHVAIPDFAFGAMENLGCVTYRESVLLIDPAASTQMERERVAEVLAHETAHMWFGDLVTMRWWNGLWLNEAFATFMEMHCVDSFRPEWERWVSFGLSRETAMATDGLAATRPIEFPVARPEEAEGMFDVLTYQKGCAVLRMLEQYLGAERFRDGIRRYLDEHRYGNAETTDLWDAIEETTGEPVRATMDSWIFQGGHPLVTVSVAGDGRTLELDQRPFRYLVGDDGGRPWHVPVLYRTEAGGRTGQDRLLLSGEGARVELPGPPDLVLVNAGGSGFYRVRYQDELFGALVSAFGRLDGLERCNLVADTWACVLAGLSPAADFLALAKKMGGETDPTVWDVVLGALDLLDRVLPEDDRPRLQAFVRALAGPLFAELGWRPGQDEPERRGLLRATLLRALGTIGADPEVRARAVELHRGLLQNSCAVDPQLLGALVRVAAAAGGSDQYELFVQRWRSPANPQEELRYLYGLAAFDDPDLMARTLELALREVRPQNAPFLLLTALANRARGPEAWEFVKQHWDELCARLPDNTIRRMLEGVATLCAPEPAADAHAFLAAHPLRSGQLTVDQILERLDVHVAFAQREGAHLGRLLVPDGDDR